MVSGMKQFEIMKPQEIEKRSLEIIAEELGDRPMDPEEAPVIKRVIHTTADFEYADTLFFSEGAVRRMKEAIRAGACIVTDTQMALSGINKRELHKYGGEVYCYMSDADVAAEAAARGCTRATVSMERAARLERPLLFAIGNAPTALIRLAELMEAGQLVPEGIIAVPVGFVNVVEAKELIVAASCPRIVARGRKGGSTVAAAICNALLYAMRE